MPKRKLRVVKCLSSTPAIGVCGLLSIGLHQSARPASRLRKRRRRGCFQSSREQSNPAAAAKIFLAVASQPTRTKRVCIMARCCYGPNSGCRKQRLHQPNRFRSTVGIVPATTHDRNIIAGDRNCFTLTRIGLGGLWQPLPVARVKPPCGRIQPLPNLSGARRRS